MPPEAVATRPNTAERSAQARDLRLHYPTVTADAGPCGLWPHDLGPTYDREHYENRQYYNFGCANQRNLAAMVDNPSDLVQPRGEIPPTPAAAPPCSTSITAAKPPATIYPDADKGKISDVGK